MKTCSYSAGPWSSCSRSCGVGRRTRSVVCKQEFPGNFITTVSHRKCREAVRPETHEKCQVQDCAKWKFITEWSQVCITGDIMMLENFLNCNKSNFFIRKMINYSQRKL